MALISFINILTIVVAVVVILPSQLDAYYTQNTGCHHNGTWYADKSLVPTTEKCLNCQCSKKTLVCRLKVCPEMPMPPPRGCVVVQKKNTCCPYLSCARLDAFYKIPATRRIIAYLDHYERESIDRVVNENMLQRRSDDTDVDLYVCVKNGTVYKSGSAMSSSNLCSYCYCIGGTEKCVKPKCMLPVEGCKPIFVDSTCCPVRYDCSTKQTGKSSQEVRYRKTSNKHYMRMSQRLQRNRGCTVGEQFYAEGQKMKTDKDKPCDICFCIRGQRKCAPKKCAPALRNCIPVVPKGHCCPSSYDCGSQRDYRRTQNSRQFNLFSLLFGKDEDQDESASTKIEVQYPHDRDPAKVAPVQNKNPVNGPSTDKGLFDSIREGLEFIDSNNNQMLKDNMDLVHLANVKYAQHDGNQPHYRPSPTPIPLGMINLPSTTEVSFLDLLLGPSEPSDNKPDDSSEEPESVEEKTTPTSTTSLSWVDLLLGPDEEDLKNTSSTISDKLDKTDSTYIQDNLDVDSTTSIDRLDHDSNMGSEESVGELMAEQQDKLWTSKTDLTTVEESMMTEDTTQTLPTTLTETTEEVKSTEPLTTEVVITTKKPTRKLTTTTTTKKPKVNLTTTTKGPKRKLASTTTSKPEVKSTTSSEKPIKAIEDLAQKTKKVPLTQSPMPSQNATVPKPDKNSDFFSELLDGLSDILRGDNKTRNETKLATNKINLNKTTTVKLPTPKPLPMFKPLPVDKTYTRINSKIANLTVRPPILTTKELANTTFKPLPLNTSKNPIIPISESPNTPTTSKTTTQSLTSSASTTTTSTSTTEKPSISTSSKPVVIKTNPTILEAEPIDQNSDPTLPPSLPNLKIIPFLPTDAVKADHNQPSSYEFYHHSSAPISRIDYDLYDDANSYPSITEKYPLYPDLEDGSKAEYIYKFNVEGPDSSISSTAGKFDGTLGSPAFLKYDFAGSVVSPSTKGFSPPTKTEGGFVPKEPLILDDDDHDNVSVNVGDSYQVTQHIIDITTSGDVQNTTKIIEITTPDPFKDVIRTEPPPDLTSLIEDKLKNLITQSSTTTTTTKTTAAATFSQANNIKPQNSTEIELNTKQAEETNSYDAKMKNQIKMTDSNVNIGDKEAKQSEDIKTTAVNADDMNDNDDANDAATLNTNDGSTIPPFKSLPQAVVKQLEKENSSTAMTTSEHTNEKSTKKQTILMSSTTATTKRPTIVKANRNRTIANNNTTQRVKQQQQQKPTRIKNSSGILASAPDTSSSSSSISSSAGSVSILKTKSNATRRVTSPKPTKYNKTNNRPTTTTNAATTTKATTSESTPKTNAINIVDITSAATRRTTKPTTTSIAATATNVNPVTASKLKISTTTKKTMTTTAKPTTTSTTIRPTTSSSATPFPLSSSSSSLLKTTTNPFFMSPFDKLPFMDASFEVKRNSATPPSFTSSKQHFAVAANIATTMLNGENNENDNDDAESSMHKLMGLVHYKHTLNQLEGLEPSTQRPQHLSLSSASFSYSSNSEESSPAFSASSTQHQQHHSASSLNNLIDPTGILKLAGCNIYGRMYRVGRIILELSSPCLECKCTEIGVKCGPLEC